MSTLAVCPRSHTGDPAKPPLARAAGCMQSGSPPTAPDRHALRRLGFSVPDLRNSANQMDTVAERILLHRIRPRQVAAAAAARHSCRGIASRHARPHARPPAEQQTPHACARHLAGDRDVPLLRQEPATATPQGPLHATHPSTHQSNERLNRDRVVFCEMPCLSRCYQFRAFVNAKFETRQVTGAASSNGTEVSWRTVTGA